MKIDPSTFASLRKLVAERRRDAGDEVEAVYHHSAPLGKDGVVRALQYLGRAGGGYEAAEPGHAAAQDTLDVSDARSGLRATLDVARLLAAAPLPLPLPLQPPPGAALLAVIRKQRVGSVGVPEYRLRVNHKRETPVPPGDAEVAEAFSPLRAGAGQLTFRLKRRYSYVSARNPALRVDVTAVRTLINPPGVPTYADVAAQPEAYEFEVEWVGADVPAGDAAAQAAACKALLGQFSVVLKLVDGAVASVLSLSEQAGVAAEYRAAAKALGAGGAAGRSGVAARFLGPKPVTLEALHLRCACPGADETAPCVLHDYTVTPKADGERRLLLVAADGRVYTVTNRTGVMDTGRSCAARRSCVLDGEHVAEQGRFFVFDAYAVDGADVRALPLMLEPAAAAAAAAGPKARRVSAAARARQQQQQKQQGGGGGFATRLEAAAAVVRDLVPVPGPAGAAAYGVELKEFRYIAEPRLRLADACRHFFAKRDSGGMPYETDGLVFTPALLAVPPGVAGGTWPAVLKWKPPELNTIDFEVRLRDADELVVLEGERGAPRAVAQLLVGQDPWLATPLSALDYLSGAAAERLGLAHRRHHGAGGEYRAMPFAPDGRDRSLCYLARADGGRLLCANGDEVFDGAVVEFAFDCRGLRLADAGALDDARRVAALWRPLRMRWDKIPQRAGEVTANNYATAASVWHTIVHPVSDADLLRTQQPCEPKNGADLDDGESKGEYYVAPPASGSGSGSSGNSSGSSTDAMRRFHNHWVKRHSLLMRFRARDGLGRSVFDFGCGTGGDLNKWVEMGASRVMGVDKFASNLYNPDLRWKGAYVRLLQLRGGKQPRQAQAQAQAAEPEMKVVFLPVDASRPFATDAERRVYAAAMDEANGDRAVAQAVWGLVTRDAVQPAKLQRYHRFAASFFDLATCMFAVHYFFGDAATLATFARNVASVLRPGGHFVGCCLDGDLVDALLARDAPADGDAVEAADRSWRITRRYAPAAPRDAYGRRVDVFMRSIGQQLPEYLVGYEALRAAMADAALVPPSREECAQLGLAGQAPTGTFDQLFRDMERARAAREPAAAQASGAGAVEEAARMSPDERRYSFLNRWFVFKKLA
jgi:SAM-dependent methyltransferase